MLKFLCGLVLVCLFCGGDAQNYRSLPKYVDGFPLNEGRALNSISPAAAADATCAAGARGTNCFTDCQTIMTCAIGVTKPLVATSCATQNPDTPYCNPGSSSCSATGNKAIPECAAAVTSDFICTDSGYFPDPKNCSRYVYCGESGAAEPYTCPYYYVYDSRTERCKLHQRSSDCTTLSCSAVKTFPGYVLYTANPAFYGLCTASNVVPIMQRCGDVSNFIFSLTSKACEFQCKADGQYPDYLNCANYYECYRYGSTYYYNLKKCPVGLIFDTTKLACVTGSCPTEAPTTAPDASTTASAAGTTTASASGSTTASSAASTASTIVETTAATTG